MVLDNYPEETSWNIKDNSGSTVASGGTYPSEPDGSTKVITNCLPAGCYTFTINDSYGDGICCSYGSGNYSLTDAGGTVLASGASFGSSETKNFCIGTSRESKEELTPSSVELDYEVLLYPNPAKDELNVEVISGTLETIEVYNLHGARVDVEIENNVVNLTNLQAGMYFIAIKTDIDTTIQRFVKE